MRHLSDQRPQQVSRRPLFLLLALVLLLAACGDDTADVGQDPGADATTPADTTEPADATEPADMTEPEETDGATAGGTSLTVAESPLGTILVDGEGATLYLFEADGGGGESTCYDQCEANWPPFTVEGDVEASAELDDALIGTTERTDGTTQATYNGHPLYYFAADQAPGDLNGQGVGDVWWVVGPDGEAIKGDPAALGSAGY